MEQATAIAASTDAAGGAAPANVGTVGTAVVPAAPDPSTKPSMDPKAAVLIDVQNRFTYHPPKDGQADQYTRLRDRFRELAENLVLSTPISREQATALTLLDQAMMMANAAIARNS